MAGVAKTALVKFIRKGEKGYGVTVLSTEVRYTYSASGTVAPTSGWQSSMPSVPQGYYLWTRTIVRYSDGSSTTTYTVAYQATDGAQGAVLRGPLLWSSCASEFQFYSGAAGEPFIDVVLHNNKFYACNVSHVKKNGGTPGGSGNWWTAFQTTEFVATSILLAQYALVKNLGVETIEMKDSAGNILFQAKDGNVTCKTGVFDGITVRNAAIESGTISGFKFDNTTKQMLAGTVGSTDNMLMSQRLIRFLNAANNVQAFLGSTAVSDALGIAYGPMRINVTRPGSTTDANIGVYFNVEGAQDTYDASVHAGNHALYIGKGHITGWRPNTRRVTTNQTLSVMDTNVIITALSDITITLPSASCEDGQEYRMISVYGKKVTVNAGAGYSITGSGESFATNRWHIYIFDKYYKTWRYSYTNVD